MKLLFILTVVNILLLQVYFLLSDIIMSMSKIVIDESKCKSCGICITVCPNKLIRYSKNTNEQGLTPAEFIDTEGKCTGCAMCAISCPEIAIKEVLR